MKPEDDAVWLTKVTMSACVVAFAFRCAYRTVLLHLREVTPLGDAVLLMKDLTDFDQLSVYPVVSPDYCAP